MPHYKITAWKYHSELLKVRRQLFELDGCEPSRDPRREAVNVVAAWRMRCALPHTIESTAFLVDAKLHQENGSNSTFSMRVTHAAAFSRFVTGFCDIAQTARDKKTMFGVAADIGMPSSFVEIRHEITHNELPSLQRLARYTQDGIEWLWDYYWKDLDDNIASRKTSGELASDEVNGEDRPTNTTSNDIRNILEQFLSQRKREIKDYNENFAIGSVSATTCVALVRNCRGNKYRLTELVKLLLMEKMLVPGNRGLGEPLVGAFKIWDNLLRRLTVHQNHFISILLSQMTSLIVQPSVRSAESDPLREALVLWILHIFEESNWQTGPVALRVEKLRLGVISDAICSLDPFAKKLASGLVQSGDARSSRIWGPLLVVYSDVDMDMDIV